MPNHPPQPFGRIRLTQVLESWSAEHSLNPRALAYELAGVLRTIGPGSQVLDATAASVTLFDPAAGAGGITLDAMADYFERYASGASADTIEATSGSVQAAAVLLNKQWLGRLEIEAEARAKLAAGLQQIVPEPFATGGIQPAGQNQLPLSGSAPECLSLRQIQQRQEGERSAGEQLDAAEQQAHRLEQENNILRAQLAAAETHRQQAVEDAETHRRAAQEERRQRTLTEEQLREHAGIIAFMNEGNPLSPVEGRRAVTAWCEMTDNGQTDPTTGTGIGVGELARRWWQSRFGEPAGIVTKHLQWALTWPARKKGGLVAKKPKEKG